MTEVVFPYLVRMSLFISSCGLLGAFNVHWQRGKETRFDSWALLALLSP